MKPISLGIGLILGLFPIIYSGLAQSSQQMQALTTKSVSEVYEKSKKAGFKKGAMGAISEKALGDFQKNAQTQRTEDFKKAQKNFNRKAKPIVRAKGLANSGNVPQNGTPSSDASTSPRRAVRRGSGPTTGGMSAGATKGAEAINFGSKKKE